MPAEAYMGRIGGFAVAAGIGAAIVCGWGCGLAWADDSIDSTGSAASSASSNAGDPDTTMADADVAPQEDTSEPATKSPVPTETSKPEPDADDVSPRKPSTSPKGSDGLASKPAKPTIPRRIPAVPDAKQDSSPPVTSTAARTTDTLDLPTNPLAGPTEQARVAVSLRTVSTQAVTVAPPNPPAPSPRHVMTRLVEGIVNAVLSPFAASGMPGAPAEGPSMWALLAFVRREFDSAMRSLGGRPGEAQTTSETLPPVESGERTLILTAFPAEADAILARTTLDPNPSVVVDGRHFYLGTLGGKKVIVAMTGIGMVNASQTTETALSHFTPESGISIGAVVFSGVAGGSGRTEIGDVAVPARWTSDDGETWRAVDPEMLAVASSLTVDLESSARLGDPACTCNPLARLPIVNLGREPDLHVGGDGSSDDNNNGVAFPAIPFGGDVFGPQPCTAPDRSILAFGNFFQAIGPFLAVGLLGNLMGILNPVVPPVDAVDQETAAAQQVADAHGVPFLGIRGMSDGPGDPLNLPGYPFSFFVYRQIAADNAAVVTEAFLTQWDGASDRKSVV
jgi:nucleoside phosphorylase